MHVGKVPLLRRLGDVQNTDPSNGMALVWSSGLGLWVPTDVATQAELDAHTALTTSAHGGIVASTDPRLSDYGPYDSSYLFSTGTIPHYTSNVAPVANTQYASRAVIPRAGTITDFVVLIGGATSGNMDAAIQLFDGTTYTLTGGWSKGSTATPAANTWTSLGNPNVAVTMGQIIFPTLAWDNITVTPARLVALGSANWHNVTGMTYPKLSWSKATSFPIPSTTADSGVTVGAQVFAWGIKIA